MMKQNSTQKHSIRPEKQQPGCIWGLFRIFDFRQSYSTQRLLSDRRHGDGISMAVGTRHSRKRLTGNSRRHKESCSSVDDVVDARVLDEPRSSSASTGQMPMKTLIANEMINDNRGDCFSTSERRQSKVHQKQKFRTSKVVHDLQSDDAEASRLKKLDGTFHPNPMEQFIGTIDQATSLEGFYNWYTRQVSELVKIKMCDPSDDAKGKVDGETESFVYHKSYDTGDLIEDGSQHLKEFMDALEILDSNKELFVKLLQDRNSLLVKHIQGLRNAELDQLLPAKSSRSSERTEHSEDNGEREHSKQNLHRYSRMRHKLWGGGSSLRGSDMSQNSTKIVILKPGTPSVSDNMSLTSSSSYLRSQQDVGNQEREHDLGNQEKEKLSSPFSLKEIKRKLRLAISDAKVQWHHISMDDVLHRIPYGSQSSEEMSKSLSGRHVEGEPSKLPERTSRVLGRESWRQKSWRPLRPQTTTVDELSTRGCSFLENKNMAYSRSLTQPRETAATREGRRHIYEILSARDAVETLSTKPTSRTLGRVLSLPDHILLSPRLSPRTDFSEEIQTSHSERVGLEFSSLQNPECRGSQMQDLALGNPVRVVNEVSASTGVDGASMAIQDLNLGRRYTDGIQDDNSAEELTCTVIQVTGDDEQKIEPVNTGEEEINQLNPADSPTDFVEEQCRPLPDLCICSPPERMENIANVESSIPDSVTDIRSPVHPSSCECLEQAVLSQNVCEKPHEPSPVSVLEPALLDLSSPEIETPTQQETLLIYPRKINFEEMEDSQVFDSLPTSRSIFRSESKMTCKRYEEEKGVEFEYVKSLLEASNFTGSKDFVASIDSSDQPLHQSLFLLIDPPGEVSVDQLLLFDIVNEVLLEISNRRAAFRSGFSCSLPPVLPILWGEHLLEDIWTGTKWHLSMHSQASRTLEEIVGRDLAKDSRWMDLTCCAESIGIDIEVALLEDLIQETAIELAS